MNITKKGQSLMLAFSRKGVEVTEERMIVLSRIARLATTYSNIQVRWCNDEMSDFTIRRLEARETRIEECIKKHAEKIGLTVSFEGDPRGHVVRLFAANPRGEEDYIGADID